jgi:hypothetical protein
VIAMPGDPKEYSYFTVWPDDQPPDATVFRRRDTGIGGWETYLDERGWVPDELSRDEFVGLIRLSIDEAAELVGGSEVLAAA